MKKAFVTFLGTVSFLPGVLVLNQSLKATGHQTALLVLVTDEIDSETLRFLTANGMSFKLVDPVPNPCAFDDEDIRGFQCVYTKLRLFELAEFDKIVFVDADMLICNNIEHLFNAPHLSAVVAGGMYPGNESWKDLNSGLMVVEPSVELFEDMLAKYKHLPSMSKCDQGFLHSYFAEWPSHADLHLPHGYNVPVSCLDLYCKDEIMDFTFEKSVLQTRDLYVLHFWGPVKPWQLGSVMQRLNENSKYMQALCLWWHYFDLAV